MESRPTHAPDQRQPLRLWPGVVAAVLIPVLRFGLTTVWPDGGVFSVLGPMVSALLIVVWWLFFSRAPWPDRLSGLVVMIAAMAVAARLAHESIAAAGRGALLYISAIPVLALALVVWAVASRRLSSPGRLASLVATFVIAAAPFALIRTAGVTSGVIGSELHWRWTPTPEERFLAVASNQPLPAAPSAPVAPATSPATSANASPAATGTTETPQPGAIPDHVKKEKTGAVAWSGFRGPGRNSVIRGVQVETDWSKSAPVELWRHPVGPGWSSFAVDGDIFYTQEQHGEQEVVAAYRMSTGQPVWRHTDPVRFWESNGGAGPRATPTLSNGRIYTFGATGIVNALDSRTGSIIWSRNAATDTETSVPEWGFTSSPLVVNDLVVIGVSGQLAAYDLVTGAPRWVGPKRAGGYSSPHFATLDGVDQIVLLSGNGATSVVAATGAVLWEHEWSGSAIVQPGLTADGDVLINSIGMTGGAGLKRLAVTHGEGGWTVEERWTSTGLKPYYNDFVVHKGHAFGFDGNILSCIDLADGRRAWKGGRYGAGQALLLADQDVLLISSEDGDLALVRASADTFTELARVPALNGKTWNHPVLVGDVLLVRNGEEMAAFRLTLASR